MKIRSSISLLLAIVLLFSFAAPAYAEEYTGNYRDGITATQDVPVTTTKVEVWDNNRDESMLGVEIVWNVSTLELRFADHYGAIWNPESLRYEKDYSNPDSYDVTFSHFDICNITNRSLYDITVTPSFTPVDALKDTGIENVFQNYTTFTAGKATAAEDIFSEGTVGETVEIYYQISSSNSVDLEEVYTIITEENLTTVGTVTLTITKATS